MENMKSPEMLSSAMKIRKRSMPRRAVYSCPAES